MKVRSLFWGALLLGALLASFWTGRLIQANEDAQDRASFFANYQPDVKDAQYSEEVCNQTGGANVHACFDYWYTSVYEVLSNGEVLQDISPDMLDKNQPSYLDKVRQWCALHNETAQDANDCIILYDE